MRNKCVLVISGLLFAGAAEVAAQATMTPSFNSPVRAFVRSELGGIVSFPEPGGTGYEAAYRYNAGGMDVGFRAGVFDATGPLPNQVLAGVEFRAPMMVRSEDFPLDAALIAGVGGRFRSGANMWTVPVGASFGRRIFFNDSERVSLAPYIQPTMFVRGGTGRDAGIALGFGVGADLRLNGSLDVRFSAGLGDVEGISLGAVWIH